MNAENRESAHLAGDALAIVKQEEDDIGLVEGDESLLMDEWREEVTRANHATRIYNLGMTDQQCRNTNEETHHYSTAGDLAVRVDAIARGPGHCRHQTLVLAHQPRTGTRVSNASSSSS